MLDYDLDTLINSIDIVDFISNFVDLELEGDEWWGLSCFNEENTPSFSVRNDPPVFYDYSSGIGGNVYTFVRHYYKCGPRRAIQIMANYLESEGVGVPKGRKMSATKVSLAYRKPKQRAVKDEGVILPRDYMDRYELDWEKLQVWVDEGISRETLLRFQVRYDPFSNRIVYPIRNIDGEIVNVGGRTLDPDWKKKKLRKYTYFYKWGTLDVLYGLSDNMEKIKNEREVILFEGCKSVLLAHTWGIENTAAILTSHLNPQQVKILAKLGCRTVFGLDKDVDVRKDININSLKRYTFVQTLDDKDNLLDEKDAPVDKGIEVFEKLYGNRRAL